MRGLPHYPLPGIAETLEANLRVARLTNADVQVVGIALNTSAMAEDDARALCAATDSYLDEVITDDRGGRMFVCSDTDYCRQRTERLEENLQ